MRAVILCWLPLVGLLHAAGLTFEKPLLEVEAAADAGAVVAEFKFTNKTDKPVTIAKVDKTCSCIGVQVAGGKMAYGPGESGVIRASFDLGNFSGTTDKGIVLWLDDDRVEKPSQSLTVRVHIPVLVAMDVKTLKWELGAKPEPQKIDIKMTNSKPIRIISVNSSSEVFKTEVKTLEEGKHYELWVTPLVITNTALAIIRIETDCEIPRHKLHQAFALIRRPQPGAAAAAP